MLRMVIFHPQGGEVFESHPGITTVPEAMAYVRKGWAQEGDKVRALEQQGRITPIVVICEDGEACDVFGQLVAEG